METTKLILVEQFCTNCNVEFSFINSLNEHGIIEFILFEEKKYISNEHLKAVERAILFHDEFNINFEGIDVILNLLDQIGALQQELNVAKNKSNLFDIE